MKNSDSPILSSNGYSFMQGGGEMGVLIRAKDWSNTPLGHPETWPQSLRTMVSVMLDNPFGMYIAWGTDYTQIYNDGYRPILGTTKHPQALGTSTTQTFAEIWHIIGPMFDGVMQGQAVGFPDFMLPLNRNGFVETCYFDFSYSPIRKENGEVGGVLVTVIETTSKKKAEDDLMESKDQLQFAVEATELATWDYNPATNKFTSNKRLKEWFGLKDEPETDLQQAINSIAPADQNRVSREIQQSLQYAYGGKYDIEFTIIHPVTLQERIVSTKGRAWFDDNKIGYRLYGTVQDITEQAIARKKLEQSEEQLRIALEGSELGTFDYFPLEGKLSCSAKTKELFGLPPDAPVNLYLFMQALYPEDKTTLQATAQQKMMLQNGGLYDIEYRTIGLTDSKVRWVRSKGIATCDVNNNPVRYTGVVQDITDRKEAAEALKESEERFRGMADNISQLAWMAEADGYIFWYNKKWYEYTGTSLDEMKGWGWQSVHDPERLPEVLSNFKEAIERAQPFEMTFPLKGADGKFRHFLTRMLPFTDSEGKIYQWFGTNTDITAHMEVEQRLKESEQRFQAAIKATSGVVWTNNSKGEMEGEQPEWSNLTGQRYDEYQGHGWAKAVHPDDAQPTINEWAKAVETKSVFHFEHRLLKKNGEWGYFSIRSIPLLNTDGSVREWVGVHTDITEKRNADIALLESEQNLRNTILQAPVAMCMLKGENFVIDLANDRMFELWGTTAMAVMHKPIFEGIPEVRDQGFEEILQGVFTTGKTFSANGVPVTLPRNGAIELVYVNFVYEPYREADGIISGILAVAIDVTAQITASKKIEEREQKFRLLADSMPQHIWTADMHGNLNYFNQSVYDYSGLTPEQIDTGGWIQIVHPDDREENITAWTKAVGTGTDFHLEHRFKRYDGVYRWQLSRAVPQRDAEGNIKMWVGTSTDIQEMKEMDQQKDDFISIASHEMKTPLTSVKGYLQLLLLALSKENPTGVLYVNRANQAVDRLHNLVVELLDASKIQNGQLNYNISTFDFNQMIDETIENMQHTAPDYRMQKTGMITQLVTGDKDRLQQVLINLLSNAIKYSPQADKVLIKIEEQVANVLVSVQDFGIGMSAQHTDKIFNRYYRIKEHAVHFQGLGIGLYLSSNIILRHKGSIWAESEPGKGSTFYFSIPFNAQ